MAPTHLTKVLFSLAIAALPCAADIISNYTYLRYSPTPTGRHLTVSDTFSVPDFDPSLGTLTAIQYQFFMGGGLTWNILSWNNPIAPTIDYPVQSQVDFLGVTDFTNEFTVFGGDANSTRCGLPAFPQACYPGWSGISESDVSIVGTIGMSSSTAGTFNGWAHVVGVPQIHLGDFLGIGSSSLPFVISVDARPDNHLGVVYGDLIGPQAIGAGLFWNYVYTPETHITETPEPKMLVLGGLAMLALVMKGAATSFRADSERRHSR